MARHEKIDYIELSTPDLEATKAFFSAVFGWKFTDYGPDYTDCPDGGVMIGFFRGNLISCQETGGALATFYSEDLEATMTKVKTAGGKVIKPTFPFPGGRRFQFLEPGGNEFAVWTDKGIA